MGRTSGYRIPGIGAMGAALVGPRPSSQTEGRAVNLEFVPKSVDFGSWHCEFKPTLAVDYEPGRDKFHYHSVGPISDNHHPGEKFVAFFSGAYAIDKKRWVWGAIVEGRERIIESFGAPGLTYADLFEWNVDCDCVPRAESILALQP